MLLSGLFSRVGASHRVKTSLHLSPWTEPCPLDRIVHEKLLCPRPSLCFLLFSLSPSENQAAKPKFFKFVVCNEPRPRLSFHFLSFSFGRKALVAAGHITSQNLGGKKNLLDGRGGIVFWLLPGPTLWVSKPREIVKNFPLYRGFKSNIADQEC